MQLESKDRNDAEKFLRSQPAKVVQLSYTFIPHSCSRLLPLDRDGQGGPWGATQPPGSRDGPGLLCPFPCHFFFIRSALIRTCWGPSPSAPVALYLIRLCMSLPSHQQHHPRPSDHHEPRRKQAGPDRPMTVWSLQGLRERVCLPSQWGREQGTVRVGIMSCCLPSPRSQRLLRFPVSRQVCHCFHLRCLPLRCPQSLARWPLTQCFSPTTLR